MSEPATPATGPAMEAGAYEVIRKRLDAHASELRARLERLDADRVAVFGGIETSLLTTIRLTTENNCVPRDLTSVGPRRFLFGYNVQLGLRTTMRVEDVFAVYDYDETDHSFHAVRESSLDTPTFREDFAYLYRYYKNATFLKFHRVGPHLYFVVRVGRAVDEVKVFKWKVDEDAGRLEYLGNRFDHEFVFPPRQEFEWKRATRDQFRQGGYPHVSIEDRVFVETVGGDLTVKVEDNTSSGMGVYAEPVDNPDQQLDDAEIHYVILANLVLMRVLPYQEKTARHLVFNARTQEVHRVDSIGDSCVLLPDQHGLIFPDGYALQTGEVRRYPVAARGFRFERRISAPNGEDTLFIFYDIEEGRTLLLSYNLIRQTLVTPLLCNGLGLFPNGEMLVFLGDPEPRKHHVVQVWKTPYLDGARAPEPTSDSYLARIGNADLVRCMAECRGLLTLLGKQDSYSGLYVELSREAGDIIDGYFWVNREETHHLKDVLADIRAASEAALGEFEKVRRLRKHAADQTEALRVLVTRATAQAISTPPDSITGFVEQLSDLRSLRGKVLALRDVRYVDTTSIARMEKAVVEATDSLSQRCSAFLVEPEALAPYRAHIAQNASALDGIKKANEAAEIDSQLEHIGSQLELLTGIVSGLNIRDATETTRIVENISELYARLNQVRSSVRNRRSELARLEGASEFQAQLSLLAQGVVNQLETSTTPAKCDEALTRMLVQIEEVEGRFAEFDEFLPEITAKREEIYTAFQARRQALLEARNKRCQALGQSAERILTGLRGRAAAFASAEEMHAFLAGDAMAAKLRDLLSELRDLGDSVRADELQTRLKSLREDALKQIRDKADLYEGGGERIRLGQHAFSVNRQALELTILPRDHGLCYHLTGTAFFEKIEDPALDATREVWDREVVSETDRVYRSEYLAHRLLEALESEGRALDFLGQTPEQQLVQVRDFMHQRYTEGYTKGVHDSDALTILVPLARLGQELGLLRHAPSARGLAMLFWHAWPNDPERETLAHRMQSGGRLREFFGVTDSGCHLAELDARIGAFFNREPSLQAIAVDAGFIAIRDTLLAELRACKGTAGTLPTSRSAPAIALSIGFRRALGARLAVQAFDAAFKALAHQPIARFLSSLDWIRAVLPEEVALHPGADIECAALLTLEVPPPVVAPPTPETRLSLTGLHGAHARIDRGSMVIDYHDFFRRLAHHDAHDAPAFLEFQRRKQELLDARRRALRLHEFKANVLSSFVRNRLLDKVYLPLIGANLAKQIGAAGTDTRTDRMGLLMLISPPGYGKTTLMEYVADRLGITFVKINGPALGHRVTSLDPNEAPNASAREEVERINLAFEMGDNVMIYVDDIQHTHPEFLQKFISLCDGQRKIEGVFKGRARTYDLRGRKVAVVMAGNPYTEIGGKFEVPDMLANRADTFNLGDILGGHEDAFRDSYIENALTSHPVLARIAARSHSDAMAALQIATGTSREGVEFEANHAPEDISEAVDLLTRMIRVRNVLLRVNQEYIRSAATDDAYRTEPPFKLQGSYRNMNRIVEKMQPMMTETEVLTLIEDHYRGEAQTLRQAAEANLLKWKEINGLMTEEDARRWDDIRRTFRRNLLTGGAGDNDPVSRITGNLNALGAGLDRIGQAVDAISQPASLSEITVGHLQKIIEGLRAVPVNVQIQVLPVERDSADDTAVSITPRIHQGDAPDSST